MDNPSFFLEAIVKDKNQLQDFEGPLSLILSLLSKNKIEIRDISISDILDQYLEYLEQMQSMDLEIASEFVQMAAHLLYIKTQTLLRGEEEVSELEVLMASLEQLKCKDIFASVQKLLPDLKQASERGLLYYSKQPEPPPKTSKEYSYHHEPVDLLKAMYRIYERGVKPSEQEDQLSAAVPKRIIYSVRDKSEQLLLKLMNAPATINEIYAECESRSELVAAFISILELCSMGSIRIEHIEDDYRLEFVGGDMESIIDSIIE